MATLLGDVIQDTGDPEVRKVYKASTVGWILGTRTKAPTIMTLMPKDFGSQRYYSRRENELQAAVRRIRDATSVVDLFDSLLDRSEALRDHLWVAEREKVAMARRALLSLHKSVVATLVEWTIKDYWTRRSGWPDLLAVKNIQLLFSEVKSPNDRLGPDQMDWFQWIVEETDIPCEICKVEKQPPGDRLDLWGVSP